MRPFLGFLALLVCSSASAELFQWTDEHGSIHVADSLTQVPAKYRDKFKNRVSARPTPQPAPAAPAQPPAPQTKAKVPFHKQGTVVIVEAMLNGNVPVNMVVDTGASITMISKAAAKRAGIDVNALKGGQTVKFQTANGTVEAPMTVVKGIGVGGIGVMGQRVVVHDWNPDPEMDGLLGLDFLSRFKMDIDVETSMFTLEIKDGSQQIAAPAVQNNK